MEGTANVNCYGTSGPGIFEDLRGSQRVAVAERVREKGRELMGPADPVLRAEERCALTFIFSGLYVGSRWCLGKGGSWETSSDTIAMIQAR